VKQYLQVHAGPYQMLLDASGVHEIVELLNDDNCAAGHRDWRGRVLTSINARSLLGMKDNALPKSHAGVVYSACDEDAPVMFELDSVACLRHVEDACFLSLPSVSMQLASLFDCVLPDKERGIQLYHLRHPVNLGDLMASWLVDTTAQQSHDALCDGSTLFDGSAVDAMKVEVNAETNSIEPLRGKHVASVEASARRARRRSPRRK
jgi:chemotaxis signal transduction protein